MLKKLLDRFGDKKASEYKNKESEYEAHQHLRTAKGNQSVPNPIRPVFPATNLYEKGYNTPKASPAHTPKPEDIGTPGFEHPPTTGVIYVMDRAVAKGWKYGDKSWGNFGQGAPEVGHIPDAPERPTRLVLQPDEFEYAPVAGLKTLREAVANLYNVRYREGKESKYTWENVCIVPGGRAGLTRMAASIGDANVGFFLPEYTAYEALLTIFKRFVPIPTPLDKDTNYHITPRRLYKEIHDRGLGVVVASNPSNPTGQLIEGDELKEWVDIARTTKTTMVLDEFYSSYIYTHPDEPGKSISSAEYIDDVNVDPILILDGMTKNFRMPGWRVCWIIGPKEYISSMASSGSFLEGGANHPLQQAAIPLLEPSRAHQDAVALQKHFGMKRQYVLDRLAALNMPVVVPPKATFYIWLDLSHLPEPYSNGLTFFEACLDEKMICVPGIFFDINPGKRRDLAASPYQGFVRLSFGPPMDELEKGLDGLERLLKKIGYNH
ncbi:aminotransferase [Rhizoclosmatium globosum]|uniref:Aminotransferase n=1 Tax=Rhizoclosmatium globosum TaxID=329046 RepID=A0A1Y2C636_9FUNG|nr:aminotransferase [Rhizoclosmatium globosum]|eukprot:ORY42503.1 aminotransferase [Rhizoclosmatium globosum]